MQTTRRASLALVPAALAGLTIGTAKAATSVQLSTDGVAALRRLYTAQPRARTLGARARAVLVFPRIVKVGVLLAGGQTGDGVLLVKGKPASYFNLSSASFGPQAGGQTFSYALFFMNDAALDYLNKSDGWSIGTGPNVVIVDKGAAATLDSTTISQDVYAIPFGQQGLMAGVDLNGSKITHIRPAA